MFLPGGYECFTEHLEGPGTDRSESHHENFSAFRTPGGMFTLAFPDSGQRDMHAEPGPLEEDDDDFSAFRTPQGLAAWGVRR